MIRVVRNYTGKTPFGTRIIIGVEVRVFGVLVYRRQDFQSA